MRNDKYWEERAARRMYKYQKAADNTADEIAKTYIKAANYINSEAETIFKTFQTKHKLTEKEAYDLINEIKDKDTLNSLKAVAEKITDPEKKKEILKIIEAPAYRFRIARLEALQRNIDSYVNELCQNEIDVTKAHYVELSEKAYNYATYDIQKNIGVMFPFDRIGRERISEILAYNWSGKLFSERIWGRGNEVNQKLKTEILTGFLTGRSYEATAKEIEKQMSAGAMEARRLVRTESTYVANISEIESYKECGVEKFRFVAVLDMKTSELCAEKDGMEFDVENARTGTNVPPLHPWCRSTTVAVIDELKRNRLKRSALDPKTGKYYTVPSDMTYGEWKKSIDERYGKGYYDKKRKMLENRNADKLQLEKYRDVLGGKNLPKSLDKFQELKYNKTDEWEDLKSLYYGIKDGTVIKNANGQYVKIVQHTSLTYKPNAITQKANKKGGIDRNYYDESGRQFKQISNNGHGHKTEEALGKHGEHAHDYLLDEQGNLRHLEARELTNAERKENDDIL